MRLSISPATPERRCLRLGPAPGGSVRVSRHVWLAASHPSIREPAFQILLGEHPERGLLSLRGSIGGRGVDEDAHVPGRDGDARAETAAQRARDRRRVAGLPPATRTAIEDQAHPPVVAHSAKIIPAWFGEPSRRIPCSPLFSPAGSSGWPGRWAFVAEPPIGAAYRNRTDDLRITRRIRAVQRRPTGRSCPAHRAPQSACVQCHPELLLADALARTAD
jgi:hypothetical protein